VTTEQATVLTNLEPPGVTTEQSPVLTNLEPPVVTTEQATVLTNLEPPVVTTEEQPVVITLEPPIMTTVRPPEEQPVVTPNKESIGVNELLKSILNNNQNFTNQLIISKNISIIYNINC